MRAWVLNSGFGFENLRLEQRPDPICGPRQVVIRVHAVSLNARDVMMAQGEYNPRQKLPLVLASDAAGEVVQCGSEVQTWRVGDRVCPIFAGLWQSGPLTHAARRSALGGPLDGTLTEFFVAEENALVALPAHLTWLQGACLPCASVTAYRALVEFAGLSAGQWLVCLGTGGVSLAALGIARALGLRVIVTSRSAAKLSRATALGAEHGIDTSHTPDWGNAVRALTEGEGAHHVLEVGGAGTIAQSVRALRLGGGLSVIGVLSGALPELDLRPLLMQDLRIQGVFVGSRETFLRLLDLVSAHRLEPQIDREFEFEDARAAFEYAASGRQFGKVVISLT
ncbi:MAG TPA: NAD(P)-dependent alcohol dehydrogenase [Polyangiaceae bacterium]|jgi:NADPH:quinone reductase-like Zn-dependent oxidoreductase|nr:NAD(P)-dependent alcohol dehydrogenase [Polyangiaceae bacterium]